MFGNSFNLSQSFNYTTPYLFYKKQFKSEINSFRIWTLNAPIVVCLDSRIVTNGTVSRQHYEKVQSHSSGKLWSTSLVHDVCGWMCSVQWVCCCTQNVSILTLANFGWIISERARGDRASKLKTHNKKGWNQRDDMGGLECRPGSTVVILVIHVWLSSDSTWCSYTYRCWVRRERHFMVLSHSL